MREKRRKAKRGGAAQMEGERGRRGRRGEAVAPVLSGVVRGNLV